MSKIEKKIINKWEIEIIIDIDSITFRLKDNSFNIYQSSFKLEYLLKFNLLSTNNTIDKMGKFILMYIDEKRIKLIKRKKI